MCFLTGSLKVTFKLDDDEETIGGVVV
jgi:hypothetical protein